MTMCSRISNRIAIFLFSYAAVAMPAAAQFAIDWTGLTTQIIDESARSEVQKIFQPLSRITFTDQKLDTYHKAASSLGMKKPTTVEALMLLEHGIRPLTISSLPTITNHKIADLGNGAFRNLTNAKLVEMRTALQKDELSDYLSASTIQRLQTLDSDGSLASYLKDVITPQLALILNNRPECIQTLRDNPNLIQFDVIHLIPYFSYKGSSHSSKFKKNAIPAIIEWNLTMLNDSTMLASTLSGEIGRIRKTKNNHLIIDIANDPLWLNYNLPESSMLNFGSTSYVTDRLGRVTEIRFIPIKAKYKDTKKRQLRGKDILKAKEEANAKPHLLLPKNFGGIETWNNVVGLSDNKENKQNQKLLEKKLSELSQTSDRPVTIRLFYSSTSDSPSLIQYFCGDKLICSLK